MLYRFAVRMGEAATPEELVIVVLDGLFDAVPAEVGAILALRENRELDLLAYRHRDPKVQTYHKVSQFVSSEVLSAREAILAEDVSADADTRNRESLAELRASSLICAPIVFEDHVLGLVHLYSITPDRRLDSDDLEFTVALARQLGGRTPPPAGTVGAQGGESVASRPAVPGKRTGGHEHDHQGDRVADRPELRRRRRPY